MFRRHGVSLLPTPEICPVCGSDVPPWALACPECGADHETGWKEEVAEDEAPFPSDLAIGEESFDYDEFVEKEFGGGGAKPRGVGWTWWIVTLLLLAAFGAAALSPWLL